MCERPISPRCHESDTEAENRIKRRVPASRRREEDAVVKAKRRTLGRKQDARGSLPVVRVVIPNSGKGKAQMRESGEWGVLSEPRSSAS